jgi:hypothetical protein
MSAPASTPPAAPAPPRGRLNPPRLLGAVAFAALGFVAVWQGFGVAGFGTDVHALRVLAAVAPLFVCGLVLVWPRMNTFMRGLAVLLGLGAAGWAWWAVPSRDGDWSLATASAEREQLRSRLAKPLLDDPENAKDADRALDGLKKQYPSMVSGLDTEFARWVETAEQSLAEKFRQLSTDDYQGARELQQQTKHVATLVHAPAGPADAARDWLQRARNARTDELHKVPYGDWGGFDRTAPGRKALAEVFPETRDALVRAEADWVDSATELIVINNLTPKPGEPPVRPAFWAQAQADILALQALDTTESRFSKARLRLFVVAHAAAQQSVTVRLDAGEYEAAFGIARKHAVGWHATAKVLGADELAKLDALRKACEGLAAFAAKAAPPAEPIDVAPAPRPRP